MDSRADRRKTWVRNSGPDSRSKGRLASSASRRSISASLQSEASSTRSQTSIASWTRCTGLPSTAAKVVRNEAWRSTSRWKLRFRMPSSSSARTRAAPAML